MAKRDELQTLMRGLRALAILNAKGLCDLASLARDLGVTRPSAYRIMNTLVAEGYCIKVPHSKLYQVVSQCRDLSLGVGVSELLTEAAIPIIEALGRELKWPLTLATPRGQSMQVRMTTDQATPFALSRFRAGYIAHMLRTTTGLLYLAYSTKERASEVLDTILSTQNIDDYALGHGRLQDLLSLGRRDGHLILVNPSYPEASLGAPILENGKVIGGLVMRYTRSALSLQAVEQTYAPRLKSACADILASYQTLAAGSQAGVAIPLTTAGRAST